MVGRFLAWWGGGRQLFCAETARDAEQSKLQATREQPLPTQPTQEAPAIRVKRLPPPHDPKGIATLRTLHGWLTILCEWLCQDITDDVSAMLSNLLAERIPIDTFQ